MLTVEYEGVLMNFQMLESQGIISFLYGKPKNTSNPIHVSFPFNIQDNIYEILTWLINPLSA